MTSRELLDKILQSPITKAIGGCFMKNDELETIKRDLERLEKINNVWHKNETMESVDINAIHLQEVYDFQHRLYEENERLKKAIEIFKKTLVVFKQGDYFMSLNIDHFEENKITKEECEILKEELEGETIL